MNKVAVCCVAGAVLLAMAIPRRAVGQDPPESAPAKKTYTVAAIGDSLTDPKSFGGKYLEYVAQRCPKSKFDNYGKGGQMVNQMRARFARDVLGDPPDPAAPKPKYSHVVVFGGVNDIGSDDVANRTIAKITGDLGAMYDSARGRGIRVIAINIAPWGGFKKYFNARRSGETVAVNRWIAAQKRAGRVDYLVDSYKLLSCGQPDRLCKSWALPDQLHINAEGHRRLGEALFARVFSDCE